MRALLALGSNIDPERNLPSAMRAIAALGHVVAVSGVYQSAPQGGACGPDYLNAALLLETALDGAELKSELRALEAASGRDHGLPRTAPRPLDIDIVLAEGRPPHPDLLRFAHVAVPAAEVDPARIHPHTGETLAAIAGRVGRVPLQVRPDVVLPAA